MQPPIPAPLKVPTEFLNEPAAAGLLEATETTLGRRLPEDYAALMQSHDGGAFSLGEVEVSLWTLEELPEWNATFKVATSMPSLLIFGSNCHDEAFAFDLTSDPWSVVAVPFLALEERFVVPIASSFTAFVERLASGWTLGQGLDEQRAARASSHPPTEA